MRSAFGRRAARLRMQRVHLDEVAIRAEVDRVAKVVVGRRHRRREALPFVPGVIARPVKGVDPARVRLAGHREGPRPLHLRPHARAGERCHLHHARRRSVRPQRLAAWRRRQPRRAKNRLRLVRGDIRYLPFAPASFDAVLAPYGILQSLVRDKDLKATLDAVAGVLAPGGLFGVDLVPDVPN